MTVRRLGGWAVGNVCHPEERSEEGSLKVSAGL